MNNVWKSILDFVFPEKCVGCGREGSFLCNLCFVKITSNRFQVCPVCKKASYQGKTHHEKCKKKTNLDGLLVAATYHENPYLEKSIKQFKYHYSKDLGEKLGLLLVKTLKECNFSLDFILCPIPLHKKRRIWRGFNQADVLTDVIGKYLPYEKNEILRRVKNTKQQALLTRKERIQNLKDAFTASDNLSRSQHILLIDDVSSSLATLEEAAKALKRAGVTEVYGLVLARG